MRSNVHGIGWGWLAISVLCASASAAEQPMVGFAPAKAGAERAVEARFDSMLSAMDIRTRLKLMSSAPNQVGSPHDKANAEYVLGQFKAWGWDAHIETFSVLYPTPMAEALELLGPEPFSATLSEPPIPGDESTSHQDGGLPAYLAYGGDGDVAAPLIYVNYGMPADYEALQRLGLDVRGKIVIARYGGGWRGLKPKLAQEHGAVGCIIYSDPADDGYGAGDPYPKGAFRPEHGVQRGSVQDIPVQSGDPLTPGYGATAEAPRIARDQAKTILKIPVLPISWGDAQHFLAALDGPVAPKSWRGALPFTYHVGAGAARVHIKVESNWDQKPLYDVIATLKGDRDPDQWVIRGNHRDGWVFGAEDPLSGQSAMLEEAKSIGALYRSGWRPARTIIYASWDGEEPGLLGSTEWVETHASDLQAHAVVYINTDGNNRGIFVGEASYSLNRLIDQTTRDVVDPETKVSVNLRARAAMRVRALENDASADMKARARIARSGGDLPLGDLGSGSDYSPFVQHLGVASINLEFTGEGQSGGVYHSAYDTFEHFERFGDPGFAYSVTLAKTAGRLVLRAADADIPPLDFSRMAETVAEQVADLKRLVTTERDHALAVNGLLEDKAFALAADPTLKTGSPDAESPPPDLDFSVLDAAVEKLRTSAAKFAVASANIPTGQALHQASAELQRAEQALLSGDGLPGRPWYRHLIYAPGLLTGYGAKTLPAVREAIEGRRWEEASSGILRTAAVLNALSARVEAATNALIR